MGILLNKSKNYIINGAMDFWQRGTSFASIANGTYCADRFQYTKNGTMVHTVSRSTDVPSSQFDYSARLNLTNFQNTITATNFTNFDHKIEGFVFAPLLGKSIVVSFWVKATLVGKYPFSIRNGSQTRSYVSTFDILQSNTWEKKTINIAPITSGTWLKNQGIGALTTISLVSGSTYQAPSLDTWLDGNFISHSSCVNGVQSGATDFFITGIQLEEGVSASNFERAGGNFVNELQLCLRYCELSVFGAIGAGSTGYVSRDPFDIPNGATAANINQLFRVLKRAIPNITIYGVDGIGTSPNTIQQNGVSRSVAVDGVTLSGFRRLFNTSGVTWPGGTDIAFNWVADAEL